MTRLTVILTQRDVERLIDIKTAIRVVAQAFRARAEGRTVMPPKLYLPLPRQSDFRAMPAFLAHPPACGVKWVNVHPHNRARGLPTVMAVIILNDPATGFPMAVMDGLAITGLRTGASAGVATDACARADAAVVGLVGCGGQALCQLQALEAVRRLRQVRVWGYRRGEARAFCARAQRRIAARLTPVSTVEACVRGADIITTITTSRRPLVMRRWVKPGAHLNAVGADAAGKQELDPQILRQARVFVDDREQAIHGGELNVPIAKGLLSPRIIRGTVGDVLLGRIRARTRAEELTVFDSTGVAVHDIALAAEVFRRARRLRVGRRLALVANVFSIR